MCMCDVERERERKVHNVRTHKSKEHHLPCVLVIDFGREKGSASDDT